MEPRPKPGGNSWIGRRFSARLRASILAWIFSCLWLSGPDGRLPSAWAAAPEPSAAPAASAGTAAASPASPANGTQAIVAFDAANKLYEQGKFVEAAQAYQQLLDSGQRSPALHFNLGNAWFKAGQTGRAIAAYRMAERLTPRDPNVQFNLNFARRRVTSGDPSPAPMLERLVGGLTFNEWTVLTAVAFWGALLLLAAGERRDSLRPGTRRYAVTLGAVALLGAAALVAHRRTQADKAVITSAQAIVRSGPLDEAKVLHQFPDGTEVNVLDQKIVSAGPGQTWLQVRNPAQQIGWVKADQLIVLPLP